MKPNQSYRSGDSRLARSSSARCTQQAAWEKTAFWPQWSKCRWVLITSPMSAGVMSRPARASATDWFTTRQSFSTSSGPPHPVSTSTAPPGWVITKPCTGHSRPSTPRRLARCSRLTSSTTVGHPQPHGSLCAGPESTASSLAQPQKVPALAQPDDLGAGDPADADPHAQLVDSLGAAPFQAGGGRPHHAQRPDLMRRDRAREDVTDRPEDAAPPPDVQAIAHAELGVRPVGAAEVGAGPEYGLRPAAGVVDRDDEALPLAEADRHPGLVVAVGGGVDGTGGIPGVPPGGRDRGLERGGGPGRDDVARQQAGDGHGRDGQRPRAPPQPVRAEPPPATGRPPPGCGPGRRLGGEVARRAEPAQHPGHLLVVRAGRQGVAEVGGDLLPQLAGLRGG